MRCAGFALLLGMTAVGPSQQPTVQQPTVQQPTVQQPTQRDHVGPITAVQVRESGILALSQGGLSEHPLSEDGTLLPPASPLWRDPAARGLDFARLVGGGLVVVGGRPGETGTVWWLDADGTVRSEQQVAEDLLYAVVAAPVTGPGAAETTPDAVVVGAADGRVLWLEKPGGRSMTLATHAGPCRDLAVAAAGSIQVISGGGDGVVFRLPWNVDGSGQPDPGTAPPITDHSAPVDAVAVTPDGTIASGARDGRVRIHDREGKLLRTLPRLDSEVLCLAAVIAQRPGSAVDLPRRWAAGLADGRLLLLDERPGREPRLLDRQDGGVQAIGVGSPSDGWLRGESTAWLPRPLR